MGDGPMSGGAGGARRASGARALVVVDEQVRGRELHDSLLAHLGTGVSEVFVVAPALAGSALKHTMGDIDDAIEPARRRLETAIEALRGAGFQVSGEVGDSDPIQAISDELVKFAPHQIVVVGHEGGDGAFAERGLLEQAERDFDVPVLEILVTHGDEPRVFDVKSTEPAAGRRKGWRPSYNWPPLSRREVAGILVAAVGTVTLAVLAASAVVSSDAQRSEEGRLGAAAVAAMLIAIGISLINLAHLVGLFLFQSVGYKGMFSRFFARLSLYGTPAAVIACLILWLASR